MSQENTTTNYHIYLECLRDHLEPIIKNMKKQDPDTWRGQAWRSPVKMIFSGLKGSGALFKIKWAAIPFIGPIIAIVGGYLIALPIWLIALAAVVFFFITYWLLVQLKISQMATIGHHDFHIGAFKAKRPEEYKIWYPIIKQEQGSLTGLYDIFTQLLHPQTNHEIIALLEYTKGQTDQLKTANDIYEQEREYLISQIEDYEKAVIYLVDLLKATNKSFIVWLMIA
jgi:hypothetical protein